MTRLDADTIASLAVPSGWRGTTRAVFTARFYQTLVGVRRLTSHLAEHRPKLLAETAFEESVEALCSVPVDVQRRVLGHPSAGFWVSVAWDLLNRRALDHWPDLHVAPHLRDFSRFAVSALLLAERGRLAATVRTDPAGRVVLPGAGVVLRPRGAEPDAWIRLSIDDALVTAGLPGHCDSIRVPTLDNGVELDWTDHDLRLGGRIDYDFAELDSADARRWTAELEHHFATISSVSEHLGQEVAQGLRAIVPVHSPRAGLHVSGSFQEAPGMIVLALGRRMETVEALVHEYGHQKLNVITPLASLIVDDPGEAVYYSPWRDDPRPLSGLLHAVFSFSMVTDFYRRLLELPGPAEFDAAAVAARTYQVAGQVEAGLRELRQHATFSPLGTAFIDAVDRRFLECRDSLPNPSPGECRELDVRAAAHRARWSERNPLPSLRTPGRGAPDNGPDPAAAKTLAALGLPPDWDTGAIVGRWYPGDALLALVRILSAEGAPALPESKPGESLIADLAAAHRAYVGGDFRAAAERYAACVTHDPASPYFWQCYAFALRHLGRYDESLYILTHTETLMTRGKPVDVSQDTRTAAGAKAWHVAPPTSASVSGAPVVPSLSVAAVAELRAGPYYDFVEATRGGAQLPTLIAVAHGLKPTMDVWIPATGWEAFRRMVRALGLKYHVDTYFDRFSPELSRALLDRLNTTRAVFTPTLTDRAEAHVFLARDRSALDRAVGAGWYPLVVDGRIVDKHLADHDTFGDALGYPKCCQEFFRQRNNWISDNTYYAARQNTTGAASLLANPFLRHTVYGLVSYMPCSFSCEPSMGFAGRLRNVIRAEFPSYAQEIDAEAAKVVLCVSELRMYRFTGETVHYADNGDAIGVEYDGVKSMYAIEKCDPLYNLLAQGDHCHLDGNVIHIRRQGAAVGGYRARADRHGPECPFLIAFDH